MCGILHCTVCSLRLPPPHIILGAKVIETLRKTSVISEGFCLHLLPCKVSSKDTLLIDKVLA